MRSIPRRERHQICLTGKGKLLFFLLGIEPRFFLRSAQNLITYGVSFAVSQKRLISFQKGSNGISISILQTWLDVKGSFPFHYPLCDFLTTSEPEVL